MTDTTDPAEARPPDDEFQPGTASRVVSGSSNWNGPFLGGTGAISTPRGTLTDSPYSYASRFEGAPGACPEELLAAGHAACLNHAIANTARVHGLSVEFSRTSAQLTLGRDHLGPAILSVHLIVRSGASELTDGEFADLAARALAGCAFTKAMSVPITMDATLVRELEATHATTAREIGDSR